MTKSSELNIAIQLSYITVSHIDSIAVPLIFRVNKIIVNINTFQCIIEDWVNNLPFVTTFLTPIQQLPYNSVGMCITIEKKELYIIGFAYYAGFFIVSCLFFKLVVSQRSYYHYIRFFFVYSIQLVRCLWFDVYT